jgi:hypothetical protein
MSMANEAIEAAFRERVYAEAKRTGRPFAQIWLELGGEDGAEAREVARLTQAVGKVAGELLDERARARARLEGVDYRQAFVDEAKRDPATARAYGMVVEDLETPRWKRPA